MVNLIIEAQVTFFATILNLATTLAFFNIYRRFKDRTVLFLTLGWLSYFGFWLLVSIAYLFLIPSLLRINILFLIFSGHLLLLGLREMTDISIFETRFFMFTFFSGMALYTSQGETVIDAFFWPNGDQSFILQGNYRILTSILAFLISLFYLEYTIRLLIAVPDHLKIYARTNFMGALIFGPGTLIVFIFELSSIIPGLAPVVSAIGVLVSAVAISRSPQLIYTLPFTVYHLSVLDSIKGYPLFTYSWIKEDSESYINLFSSALTGLSLFADEAVGKGQIKEIKFSEGTIIITGDPVFDIQYVILTSGSAPPVIWEGLRQFKSQFNDTYKEDLLRFKDDMTVQTSMFDGAIDMIPECFPFVPNY